MLRIHKRMRMNLEIFVTFYIFCFFKNADKIGCKEKRKQLMKVLKKSKNKNVYTDCMKNSETT